MKRLLFAAVVPLAAVAGAPEAFAYAICGSRPFPATPTMDDPSAADEEAAGNG